jgi:putative hydrolase of the HAD superfamily
LELAPEACVFIDDLPGNLKPAAALGMATVLHGGDAAATLRRAGALLGVELTQR